MTNRESEQFSHALSCQRFNEHDKKVVLAILEGNGVYNQEDIIAISEHNCSLLRKLGWLRKVKKAIDNAGMTVQIVVNDDKVQSL